MVLLKYLKQVEPIGFFQKYFLKFLNNKNFENLLPQKLPSIRYNTYIGSYTGECIL